MKWTCDGAYWWDELGMRETALAIYDPALDDNDSYSALNYKDTTVYIENNLLHREDGPAWMSKNIHEYAWYGDTIFLDHQK